MPKSLSNIVLRVAVPFPSMITATTRVTQINLLCGGVYLKKAVRRTHTGNSSEQQSRKYGIVKRQAFMVYKYFGLKNPHPAMTDWLLNFEDY